MERPLVVIGRYDWNCFIRLELRGVLGADRHVTKACHCVELLALADRGAQIAGVVDLVKDVVLSASQEATHVGIRVEVIQRQLR